MTDLELKTDRLVLRVPHPDDADRVTELIRDTRVLRNLGRAPCPYARQHAVDWIAGAREGHMRGDELPLVITTLSEGVIGAAGVSKLEAYWEIGYWVGVPYWGQGYVTEAARAVLQWAQTSLEGDGFLSGHFTDNPASGRVLEKLGFRRVGTMQLPSKARVGLHPCARYVLGAPDEAALRLAVH